MSTAYFIVLDSEEPGFDPFVDGKMLTKRMQTVNRIARSLGLKEFEDYAFHDLADFDGPQTESRWFDGSDGINWASKLLHYLSENPSSMQGVDQVAEDLANYLRVFEEANRRGLKWHLELDF